MTSPKSSDARVLRIGDVAAQTGVTVESLRYYERRGLLRTNGRRANGYREFPTEAVRIVRFIKRAQSLGFSLSEVEDLVRLRESLWTGDTPRQLRDAAVAKVRDIDQRVKELRSLRRELTGLIAACDSGCPYVDNGNASNGTSQTSKDPMTNTLPCPLVDAFDADGIATYVPNGGLEKPRLRPESRTPKKSPLKPGRRPPQRKITPVHPL
ncbi:MAG: heavy metal-responsive transcriptional regulator [Longimicrobiales bacterium]